MARTDLMPYEWMVKNTPEEEWIKGKGILLWLAFFLTEIGAGIYLVSLFLNFQAGWLIGWILTMVFGGGVHVFYLGKPMRSWRALLRPVTSELSRGLWAIFAYGVIGFFQLLPLVFSELPWTGAGTGFKVIMGVLCILLIVHGFLMMSVVRALPFWNSTMMVPLSVASGISVGSQAIFAVMLLSGIDLGGVELWVRWSLISNIVLLAIHLWGTSHSSDTARASLKRMLTGDVSKSFYTAMACLFVSLVITIWAWTAGVQATSGGVLALRFICVVAADMMVRHNIMRSALYKPIIPRRLHGGI